MKILAILSPLSCEFDLSIFLQAGYGEGGGKAQTREDRQTPTARGVFSLYLCVTKASRCVWEQL